MANITSNSQFFGIDIGNAGVRIVQLRGGGGGNPTLVAYGQAPLPAGAALSDSAVDQDKVAAVIRDLLKSAKITATHAVTGVDASQAFATVITTPVLSPADLAKAIKLQADQYIPMAVDQVKMDWQVIGPGKTPQEMQVLLVSAPNVVVNKYLSVIEKAGLALEAIEINGLAQTRSFATQPDVAVVILDIGSTRSDITIVHGGAPKLIRSTNTGGMMFTRAVSQALGLDETQADQFIRRFGLTQTKLEGQVAKAIKPLLDGVVGDIDKSAKFFVGQNPGVKIEKIILTGGTSALPELPTYLANATGLPVELGDPWARVNYPANLHDELLGQASEYSVAIGLALRSYV